MKFATFLPEGATATRFGLVLADGRIADLEGACATRLARILPLYKARDLAAVLAPPDALSFLDGGTLCLEAARETESFVRSALATGGLLAGPNGEKILFRPDEVTLKAPLANPRKFIAAGKNFRDHRAEMSGRTDDPRQPVAFAQMISTITDPEAAIRVPDTKTLDYEVEVAIVIGKRGRDIAIGEVRDHIFGYTIFNDISARDVYRHEGSAGIPLLGKNFPGFAPLGPYLCTADEFATQDEMRLQSRVNGETRQDGTLASMIFDISQIVSHWSRIGLEPGDILTTGTPKGVAAGRKGDEKPWWLKPGDVVEVEVSGIGILRTHIA